MGDANGSHVTRAELAAHIRRIDEHLAEIKLDVSEIRDTLGRPRKWFLARVTRVVDQALPSMLVGGMVLLLTRL